MEYYSAITNNDFMKFTGKWMELENIIPNEVTQIKKNTWYVFTDKWILAPNLKIPTIQPINHMELKKKEEQNVEVSIPYRRGNKILTRG